MAPQQFSEPTPTSSSSAAPRGLRPSPRCWPTRAHDVVLLEKAATAASHRRIAAADEHAAVRPPRPARRGSRRSASPSSGRVRLAWHEPRADSSLPRRWTSRSRMPCTCGVRIRRVAVSPCRPPRRAHLRRPARDACRNEPAPTRSARPRQVKAEDGAETSWRPGLRGRCQRPRTLLSNQFDAKRRNRKHASAALFGTSECAAHTGRLEGSITLFWFEHGWFWFIPLLDGPTSVARWRTRPTSEPQGRPQPILDGDHPLAPKLAERLQDAT